MNNNKSQFRKKKLLPFYITLDKSSYFSELTAINTKLLHQRKTNNFIYLKTICLKQKHSTWSA